MAGISKKFQKPGAIRGKSAFMILNALLTHFVSIVPIFKRRSTSNRNICAHERTRIELVIRDDLVEQNRNRRHLCRFLSGGDSHEWTFASFIHAIHRSFHLNKSSGRLQKWMRFGGKNSAEIKNEAQVHVDWCSRAHASTAFNEWETSEAVSWCQGGEWSTDLRSCVVPVENFMSLSRGRWPSLKPSSNSLC